VRILEARAAKAEADRQAAEHRQRLVAQRYADAQRGQYAPEANVPPAAPAETDALADLRREAQAAALRRDRTAAEVEEEVARTMAEDLRQQRAQEAHQRDTKASGVTTMQLVGQGVLGWIIGSVLAQCIMAATMDHAGAEALGIMAMLACPIGCCILAVRWRLIRAQSARDRADGEVRRQAYVAGRGPIRGGR
jgi:uncharacterized membrane protein YeaQ/YmgE (transglycosylase-associated protein family)